MTASTPALVEVGDRVWVARHEWYDATTTFVGGERGLKGPTGRGFAVFILQALDYVSAAAGPSARPCWSASQ